MIRCVLYLVFLPISVLGQFTYTMDQSIPVEMNEQLLTMPWAGGINSAQVSTMDFDGDNKEDVVVYDRSADKVLPYRNNNGQYAYAPEYAALFPGSVTQWMLLRDLNCDGKKDLFTSDPFGIAVFINTTKPGQKLSWRPYNPGFPLLTIGFDPNSTINLKINASDVPAIDDIDGDGDLDILNMRFVGVGTIEFHRNMAIENTGRCDSMQLKRITQTWGGVEECMCGIFGFGQSCDELAGNRTQHIGGKTLVTVDLDNDGDRELLYSEESCAALYMMRNVGTKDNALFNSAVAFPVGSPAAFPLFPGAYLEDVTFDGLPDLIASPNLYARQGANTLVSNSVWLYANTGSTAQPTFTFQKNNFLQENMIDVGDFSAPALFDTDNDGDEDLFIGLFANRSYRGTLYHFENVGTSTEPSFKFITDDYGTLANLYAYNLKPQFADMNGDGTIDLVITSTSLMNGETSLSYVSNESTKGLALNFDKFVFTEFLIGSTENLRIADVNQDGIPDILLGKATGSLQYWENRSNNGLFNQISMKEGAYLGLGNSTSRQSPAVTTSDLDADGLEDLIMGDQRGNLSIYGNYRSFDRTTSIPVTDILYNSLLDEYISENFGGKVLPTVGNLFNASKPALVLGNTTGGIYILRNDGGLELPEDPVVTIGPNPLRIGEDLKIKSDRNTRVQIFSILGQAMSKQIIVPANQIYPLPLQNMSAGLYVARFTFPDKTISIKFILQ